LIPADSTVELLGPTPTPTPLVVVEALNGSFAVPLLVPEALLVPGEGLGGGNIDVLTLVGAEVVPVPVPLAEAVLGVEVEGGLRGEEGVEVGLLSGVGGLAVREDGVGGLVTARVVVEEGVTELEVGLNGALVVFGLVVVEDVSLDVDVDWARRLCRGFAEGPVEGVDRFVLWDIEARGTGGFVDVAVDDGVLVDFEGGERMGDPATLGVNMPGKIVVYLV
jgi:hypothetical protein